MLSATYACVSNKSSKENLTTRLSILSAMKTLGIPGGVFAGKFIFAWKGYYGIYLSSALMSVTGLIYTVMFLSEEKIEPQTTESNAAWDKISPKNVTEAIKCVAKPRSGYKRAMILTSIGLLFVHDLRTKTSGYLYTNKKFGWNAGQFAVYNTVDTLHNLVRALVVLPFLSKVHSTVKSRNYEGAPSAPFTSLLRDNSL